MPVAFALPAIALGAVMLAKLPSSQQLGLSALPLAIVMGMIYGHFQTRDYSASALKLIRFSQQRLLRAGIILFGFSLSLQQISAIGWHALLLDTLMVLAVLACGLFVGLKLLKLERDVVILTTAGSAICGAAAILATEAVLRPKQRDISVAVATVVIFGTLAMFSYPVIFQLSGSSPQQFGFYIGSTVHEVAQAVAAGEAVGGDAIETAIVVKLVRVLLLAPFIVALGIGLQKLSKWARHTTHSEPKERTWSTQAFRTAAEQGDRLAQHKLGLSYYTGIGVVRDYTQSVQWHLKAATQGYAPAEYSLALRYAKGNGVRRNFAKAAEWYAKAARHGHAKAQTNLANLYRLGRGVSQDIAAALRWYRRAAGQGDTKAQINLAMMSARGVGVEKNEAEGLRWLRLAAQAGDPQAIMHLRILSRPAEGVSRNLPRTDVERGAVTPRTSGNHGRDPGAPTPIVIPWFVLGFIIATGINSWLDIPAMGLGGLQLLSQLCLAFAMAALGMQTQWRKLKDAGIKPLTLALILFVLLLLGGFGLNQALIHS